MSVMEDLYRKVAADSSLQAEFAGIIEKYYDKPDDLKEKLLILQKMQDTP